MDRKIFAALVAILFFYVASPLVFPVAMGAVLAVLFIPWLEALERRGLRTPGASAAVTLAITLLVLLPSSIMIFGGTRAAFLQIQALRVRQAQTALTPETHQSWVDAFISIPRIHGLLERITTWFPIQLQQLIETAQDLTRAAAGKLAELLGDLATRLPGMMVALAVVVVSVYFFLVDGRKLVHFFRRNSVFTVTQTDQLMAALAGTCRSVIMASLVSGVAQATLEALFCLVVGVPNVTLIGVLVFVSSFVPVIGAAPITVSVALYQLLLGRNVAGIVLLVGAGVVMFLDNVIRPLFLKGSANLHPLLAFVAAFGGLQTLGFSGVFLGPIIAAMFVSTLQILFREDEAKG